MAERAKAEHWSKLSELGIDFGAAELGRYAELSLTETQKKGALGVVRGRRVQIESLCEQMAVALRMSEATLKNKQAKEAELAEILEGFQRVQEEILSGLHALVTPEQMVALEAMKKQELRRETAARVAAEG